MFDLYKKILTVSEPVDQIFSVITFNQLADYRTNFCIPPTHMRAAVLDHYDYFVGSIESVFLEKKTLLLIDATFKMLPWIVSAIPASAEVHWMKPSESETKEKNWLDRFIASEEFKKKGIKEVVAVGGGIIINASAYIAERLGCDLAYVPTTVLAMSDGAIGGKVRANFVKGERYHKHAYKSFYEPNRIVIDPRFLDALPDKQVAVGMGEIIKHGVYQSKPLLEYLASSGFDPYHDKVALLKSILWAAALKSVCLNVDPEESKDGSHIIMRGAHEASDKIEEESHFTIPHGTAVAMAIREELTESQSPLLPLANECFTKFRVPFR